MAFQSLRASGLALSSRPRRPRPDREVFDAPPRFVRDLVLHLASALAPTRARARLVGQPMLDARVPQRHSVIDALP